MPPSPLSITPALFAHCRPGFETDCASELMVAAAENDFTVTPASERTDGYVALTLSSPQVAIKAIERIDFLKLAFTRQWFIAVAEIGDLPKDDRVEPLMNAFRTLAQPVHELFVETLDTDAARPLLRLCRSIEGHLRSRAQKEGLLAAKATPWRFHVCFTATDRAYVGLSPIANSHPCPMGIPRLRFPKDAPSRSALKLEEALTTLLPPSERNRWLKAGMTAVDLGAAPGGWTWVLVQNGLKVTAVDNGALAAQVAESPRVTHLHADGLRYRPPKPVDWLVCDIIEKPQLIADVVLRWARQGWCKNAVVNFKLPMKTRYPILAKLLPPLVQCCEIDHWAVKQLYHDRDEVTCFLRFERRSEPRKPH